VNIENILAVTGAISMLASALSVFFPRGSRIGYWLSKVGTDVKGHTSPTFRD
jgi:hypothetical protein